MGVGLLSSYLSEPNNRLPYRILCQSLNGLAHRAWKSSWLAVFARPLDDVIGGKTGRGHMRKEML
jgi:hypothetical protein